MITKDDLSLVMTCGACPEQYDVYLGDKIVGYLRLRHGYFYAAYPGVSGDTVYAAHTIGDGIFNESERDKHIGNALLAITNRINGV